MLGHKDLTANEIKLFSRLDYDWENTFVGMSPYHHMRDCGTKVLLDRINNEYVDILRFCLAYLGDNPRDEGYFEGLDALMESVNDDTIKAEKIVEPVASATSLNTGLDKLVESNPDPMKLNNESVISSFREATSVDVSNPAMFGVLYGAGAGIGKLLNAADELVPITSSDWSALIRLPNHKLAPIKGQPYSGFQLMHGDELVGEMRAERGKGKEYLKKGRN